MKKPEDVEESEGDEWDLNCPQDCCSYLEANFPAKEAEALGVSVDMFGKVACFYIEFLRYKRTPKASLAAHFQKEILGPKTLETKQGRKNWLQTWLGERRRVYVPKK